MELTVAMVNTHRRRLHLSMMTFQNLLRCNIFRTTLTRTAGPVDMEIYQTNQELVTLTCTKGIAVAEQVVPRVIHANALQATINGHNKARFVAFVSNHLIRNRVRSNVTTRVVDNACKVSASVQAKIPLDTQEKSQCVVNRRAQHHRQQLQLPRHRQQVHLLSNLQPRVLRHPHLLSNLQPRVLRHHPHQTLLLRTTALVSAWRNIL